MLNVFIADDNINYAINLMNYINNKNDETRVCNIAKNGKEVLEILNSENNIDVILLDYKMLNYNGEQILERIVNKLKYIDSIVIISGELEPVENMEKSEMIHSIIYKTTDLEKTIERINQFFEYKESMKKAKLLRNKIINELLYLGYDISHKGTQYLIKTINYIATNPNKNVKKLEKEIYPKIADIYNDSVHNIKCRINSATNAMYCNCEVNRLKSYFKFETDTKPKIKTIINIIMENIL